jgi:hypothetical protein
MSTTQLFWQRERPLADFSEGGSNRGNLIFVTTQKGVRYAVDDIFDDVRNDELNLVMISGEDGGSTVKLYSLEKNGMELKEDHEGLVSALGSASREVSSRIGSVVIVDASNITVSDEARSNINLLMGTNDVHVVLIVMVEDIEAMQHYLSHDPYIVIDIEEKSGAFSL